MVIKLQTADYVLAGLLAFIYVFRRTDLRTFAKALPTNLVFLIVGAISILAVSILPSVYALMAAVLITILLALLQSREIMTYIVRHHAVNGWEVQKRLTGPGRL